MERPRPSQGYGQVMTPEKLEACGPTEHFSICNKTCHFDDVAGLSHGDSNHAFLFAYSAHFVKLDAREDAALVPASQAVASSGRYGAGDSGVCGLQAAA